MVQARASQNDGERDRALTTLMVAAQAGDKTAYGRLLRDCEPIIRHAARRVGVVNDPIDDVTQETLLTVHNARQTYDPSRSFTAWLWVIAQRRAVDALRRTHRASRHEVQSPSDHQSASDDGDDVMRLLEDAEDVEALRVAITQLPPLQREAVERLSIQEQTLAQAAIETGRTVGSIKVNLHRAIKALRGRLAPSNEEDRRV